MKPKSFTFNTDKMHQRAFAVGGLEKMLQELFLILDEALLGLGFTRLHGNKSFSFVICFSFLIKCLITLVYSVLVFFDK